MESTYVCREVTHGHIKLENRKPSSELAVCMLICGTTQRRHAYLEVHELDLPDLLVVGDGLRVRVLLAGLNVELGLLPCAKDGEKGTGGG